jgi:hypothetical protein
MSDSTVVNTPETVKNTTTTTVNLDKEIPNYANELQMSMQSSIANVKQITGQFFAKKWSDAKTLMQSWSLGLDDETNNSSPSVSQSQTGGRKYRGKSKKGKKNKRKGYTKKR